MELKNKPKHYVILAVGIILLAFFYWRGSHMGQQPDSGIDCPANAGYEYCN